MIINKETLNIQTQLPNYENEIQLLKKKLSESEDKIKQQASENQSLKELQRLSIAQIEQLKLKLEEKETKGKIEFRTF